MDLQDIEGLGPVERAAGVRGSGRQGQVRRSLAPMSTAQEQNDHHKDCAEGQQEGRLEEVVELCWRDGRRLQLV